MMYRVKIRDYWFADDNGIPVDFLSWAAANDIVIVSLINNIPAKVVKQKEVRDE